MTLLTNLLIGFQFLGSLFVLVPASLIVIYLLRKKKRELVLFVCGFFGGTLLTFLLKNIFKMPRPEGLIQVTGYSFPSGHAAQSILFYSLLIILFKDKIKNIKLRYLFIFANVLFIVVGSLSRFFLGVHWISDMIGGYVLGLVWLGICMLVINRKFLKWKSC